MSSTHPSLFHTTSFSVSISPHPPSIPVRPSPPALPARPCVQPRLAASILAEHVAIACAGELVELADVEHRHAEVPQRPESSSRRSRASNVLTARSEETFSSATERSIIFRITSWSSLRAFVHQVMQSVRTAAAPPPTSGEAAVTLIIN